MGTVLQDLRYGARMLWKSPGFTVVAALALALGIGANTAIFSVVNAVLLRPLPYPEPARLVVPWGEKDDQTHHAVVSYMDFADWRAQTQTLEYVAAFQQANTLLRQNEAEPEPITGANVSADLFPLLRVQPAMGRAFTREEDQNGAAPVVVIGQTLWQRRFNSDPNIIGKQIRLGSSNATVIGLLPAGFRFPAAARRTEFLRPLAQVLGEGTKRRSSYSLRVVARLKPGATTAQAESEMRAIAVHLEAQYPDEGFRLGARLVTLHEATVGNVRTSLLVLLGAVGLVLLIACANVANLLLARAAARHREMAIRTALGASRWRVVRQLLTESLLLAALGGTGGLLLALWGVDLLIAASPINIPRLGDTGLDTSVLAFTVGVSLLTGLVFGLAPAFHASRVDLNEALKEGGRSASEGRARQRMRGLLIVSEVALSLVLLVGAGLLMRSFVRLRDVNPGFDAQNVLTTGLSLAKAKYPGAAEQRIAFNDILTRVRALPGVESAALIYPLPFGGSSTSNTFVIEGRPPARAEDKPAANYRLTSADYFKTLAVPATRGRALTERDDERAPLVVVVNESFARRFFAGEDPLGKRILIERGDTDWSHQPAREIVGIVGDVHSEGLDVAAGPEFYVPYAQAPEAYMDLVVRTSTANVAGMGAGLRDAIRQVDREQYVPTIESLTQLVADSFARRRFDALLTGLFAGVALLLAAVGIFGVVSYSVTQRTHEIGLRMALGAQRGDVLRLVLGQGLRLVLGGIAAGLVASFALTRVLADLLYGIKPTDPLTFAAVSVLLTSVALLACYIPARRATRVDPMVALRYE